MKRRKEKTNEKKGNERKRKERKKEKRKEMKGKEKKKEKWNKTGITEKSIGSGALSLMVWESPDSPLCMIFIVQYQSIWEKGQTLTDKC